MRHPAREALEPAPTTLLVLAGVAAALALAFAVPAAAAPTWLPAVPISAGSQSAFAPQIAFDKDANALAVWYRFDGANDRIETAFRPAGGSFPAAGTPISAAGQFACCSQVAFDKDGNAFAVWQRVDGANTRIEFAFRPAGGMFPSSGTPISAPGQNAFSPQIAVDKDGNAIAVWQRSDGANTRIEFALRPAGGSFPPAGGTTLSAAGQDAFGPQIAFDKDGNAIAVWNRFDGAKYRIEWAFRPAGGSFPLAGGTPISAPGQNAFNPWIAVDKDGNAIAVWERFDEFNWRVEFAFRPAGGSFPPAGGTTLSAAGQNASGPQVAFDKDGNAIVVWARSDGSSNRAEWAFRPAGGSFLVSGTPISAPGQSAFVSQLAFDSSGNAIVLSARSDGALSRAEFALRPAGGSFPTAGTPISAPGGDAFNARLAFDPSGNAIAVWERFDLAIMFYRIEAACYDAAGPDLSSLLAPASVMVGDAAAFSVAPSDQCSAVSLTTWTFGDGGSAVGTSVSHAFAAPGTYMVTATSSDAVGNVSQATRTITVASPPPTPPPALTLAGAAISGSYKESRFQGFVTISGSTSAAADLSALLTRTGRAPTSRVLQAAACGTQGPCPFSVPGGAFSTTLALSPSLLPGSYRLRTSGTSGPNQLGPVDSQLVLPAPPEGVVSRAFFSALKGSGPVTRLPRGQKQIFVHFTFAERPTKGNVRITWKPPRGKKVVVGKPRTKKILSFYRDPGGLASGTWRVTLTANKKVVKRLSLRIG